MNYESVLRKSSYQILLQLETEREKKKIFRPPNKSLSAYSYLDISNGKYFISILLNVIMAKISLFRQASKSAIVLNAVKSTAIQSNNSIYWRAHILQQVLGYVPNVTSRQSGLSAYLYSAYLVSSFSIFISES